MSISNVYKIDCLEYMKTIPNNFFDLAISDPPYGIHQSGGKNKTRGRKAKPTEYIDFEGKDKDSAPKEYFNELFRISKNQIIWGANHFISKIPYDSSCWIVWDKNNIDSDFADCELAWTSFHTAVRKFKFTWNGMLQEDMKNKEQRIHPTQKPVSLYAWLLEEYAKKGFKIFDSHMGSQSSRIACFDLSFDYWGCELSDYYFKVGCKRFNEHKQDQEDILKYGYAKTRIDKKYPTLF